MYGAKTTLYEILGVPRDATANDIARAWRSFRASLTDDTVPPDARRAALIKDAYEILSDPARREAYDRSLRAPQVVIAKAANHIQPLYFAIGLLVLALGAAGFYATRPRPNPPDRTRSLAEITTHASAAIARINAVDMAGNSSPLGLAFAIGEGVMATSCVGIEPGMELRVHIVPRHVQARVMTADEQRGLCKLASAGTGGWPLAFAGGDPRPGEKVFAAKVNAVGEATLVEGTFKRAFDDGAVRRYETSLPPLPDGRGGPLLDSTGRVVAVATLSPIDGKSQFVGIPRGWSAVPAPATMQKPAARVAPAADSAAAVKGEEASAPPKGRRVSKEREEAIGQAFRPSPSVPDDR